MGNDKTGIITLCVLLMSPVALNAQIYVLENDNGKSFFVPPEVQDKRGYIAEKIKEKGGSSWKIVERLAEKGCISRRSIYYTDGKPTRWVSGAGPNEAEAEKNARDAAMAITGAGSGNWEQTKCNKAASTLEEFNIGEIENKIAK